MSSLIERASLSGIGFEEFTPYYSLMPDYGLAMSSAADAFYSDACSLCPVDTGYLLSSIGSDSDQEGFTCYADAEYASYVDDWSAFFSVAWESALSTAEAVCEAEWVDIMAEEQDMILDEMDEELGRIQEEIDEKDQELAEKEKEEEETLEEIEEAEEEESDAEDEEASFLAGMLVALLLELLEAIWDAITEIESEKESKENEYSDVESFYETILGDY